MERIASKPMAFLLGLCLVLLLLGNGSAWAKIEGVSGATFNLTAKADYISTSDGDSFLMWGFAFNGGLMQYPGPTLILTEGQSVTVNLTNSLNLPGPLHSRMRQEMSPSSSPAM